MRLANPLILLSKTHMKLVDSIRYQQNRARVYTGDALTLVQSLPSESVDLVLTSPPYFVGKEYDPSTSPEDFRNEIDRIALGLISAVKSSGSLCFQVGIHSKNGSIVPLDSIVIERLSKLSTLRLRNRIVWHFGHGTHASTRFSGRHETILWYTKSDDYYFDLDAVRMPQKYPGKRHYKGPNKGAWSGNPLGKNPGDVWEIPNVKAGHVEKTVHPCQFPVALASRLVRALCPAGGVVLDPYMGAATTGVAALLNKRSFVGTDLHRRYAALAATRLREFAAGSGRVREDLPVRTPNPREAVSKVPSHFRR